MGVIRNYLTVALRALKRNGLYSFINIFGLAVGIAVCTLILMWVQDELSYDKFNKNGDRVFRVERKGSWQGRDIHSPFTGPLYGPQLKADYPEVVEQARLYPMRLPVHDHRNFTHQQQLFFADPGVFHIFTLTSTGNDLEHALDQPNTVVLSRSIAVRYFGKPDVVGRQLSVDFNDRKVDLQVTGVFEDVQSHVRMDMLVSMKSLPGLVSKERMNTWMSNFLYTYIMLDNPQSIEGLRSKCQSFIEKYLTDTFKPYLGNHKVSEVFQLHFCPLYDIYLKSNLSWEVGESGSIRQVTTFSIVALLILLTACINFVNLSTARASTRSLEVGVRKVSGAERHQLFFQFLAESVTMSLIALILSAALVELFMPLFSQFSGKELSWLDLFHWQSMSILFGVTITAGLLAGLYPAVFLSSFKPVHVLKGVFRPGRNWLRVSLVVLQFAISVALIISSIVIHQQYAYFSNKDLGYDKDQLLVLNVKGDEIIRGLQAFRNELLQDPRIIAVCSSSHVPSSESVGDSGYLREGDASREPHIVFNIGADEHYLETYRMQLVAGRNFSRERGTDEDTFILNEQAVKELGFASNEEAVHSRVGVVGRQGQIEYNDIVGVVRDFNFRSLHHRIGPLVILYEPNWINYVSIRLAPGDPTAAMMHVKETWNRLFPGNEYRAAFADDRLNRFYVKERKAQDLLFSFTILGIFIACLGLYGLAAFSTEQRTKEVGVRKVMGATVPRIVMVFLKDFAKWVFISVLIGWPVAWYFLTRWLEEFAYRIELSPAVFLLGGASALIIAMLTVGFQAGKAAMRNPVESLKYE